MKDNKNKRVVFNFNIENKGRQLIDLLPHLIFVQELYIEFDEYQNTIKTLKATATYIVFQRTLSNPEY